MKSICFALLFIFSVPAISAETFVARGEIDRIKRQTEQLFLTSGQSYKLFGGVKLESRWPEMRNSLLLTPGLRVSLYGDSKKPGQVTRIYIHGPYSLIEELNRH